MRKKKWKQKGAHIDQAERASHRASAIRKAEDAASRQFEAGSAEWRTEVERLLKKMHAE